MSDRGKEFDTLIAMVDAGLQAIAEAVDQKVNYIAASRTTPCRDAFIEQLGKLWDVDNKPRGK